MYNLHKFLRLKKQNWVYFLLIPISSYQSYFYSQKTYTLTELRFSDRHRTPKAFQTPASYIGVTLSAYIERNGATRLPVCGRSKHGLGQINGHCRGRRPPRSSTGGQRGRGGEREGDRRCDASNTPLRGFCLGGGKGVGGLWANSAVGS